MHQTPHSETKSQRHLEHLGLAIAGSLGEKLLKIDKLEGELPNFAELARRIEGLCQTYPSLNDLLPPGVPPTDRLDDGQTANLEVALRKAMSDQDSLSAFCAKLGQRLFTEGVGVPELAKATTRLLRQVNYDLTEVKEDALSGRKSPSSTLTDLRVLQHRLVNFVDAHSQTSLSSSGQSSQKKAQGFGPIESESLTSHDRWALDEQFRMIAHAVRALEIEAVAQQPRSIRRWLSKTTMVDLGEHGRAGGKRIDAITALNDLGIFEKFIAGERIIGVQRWGSSTPEAFEKTVPARTRELIGDAVYGELSKKYSGKRIGIKVPLSDKDEQSEGILDQLRIHRIAKVAKVPENLVIIAMRYFREKGLLKVDEGGFTLSEMGKEAGLSVRVCEQEKNQVGAGGSLDYLERIEAKQIRDAKRAVARLRIEAEPKVRWLRGLRTPESTIDTALVRHARGLPTCPLIGITDASAPAIGQDKNNIARLNLSDEPEDISGETAARTKAAIQESLKLGAHFVGSGHIEWKAAEDRAYLQAKRDKAGDQRLPDEETAADTPNREQLRNEEKKRLRPQIDALQEFIFYTCQPFELKLGRALHTSETLHRATGLDSNELEVVRGIATQMVQDLENSPQKRRSANIPAKLRAKIEKTFNDHLPVLQQDEPAYLDKLWRVLHPSAEGSFAIQGELSSAPGALFTFQKGINAPYLVEYIGQRTIAPKKGLASPPSALRNFIDHVMQRPPEERPQLCITGSGELAVTHVHGTWFVAPGTLSKRPNEVQGFVEVSGGVQRWELTQSIKVVVDTPRVQQILKDNRKRGLSEKERLIFCSSDQHIGSPAMKADSLLLGLLSAVENGADTIVLNGDLLDGANHTTLMHESQVLEYPLMGLEKQQEMVYRILDPVLDLIKAKAKDAHEKGERFPLPTFVILPGNHETNSDRPGLQGTSFTRATADHVRAYLAGMTDQATARAHVISPTKYTETDGTPLKYPMVTLDEVSKEVGFTLNLTHYVGRLGGGGPFGLASKGAGDHLIKTARDDVDIAIYGHTHRAELSVNAVGQISAVIPTATGATPHSVHVGYRDGGDPGLRPSGMFIRLSSIKPPEFEFPTIRSLQLQEKKLMETLHDHGLLLENALISGYLRTARSIISLGLDGHPTDLRG